MTDLQTREPTPAEVELVNRFLRLVHDNRETVTRAMVAGSVAHDAQEFLTTSGIPYPGIVFTDADRAAFEMLAKRGTRLENYASGLELRKLFFRPNATLTDIDLVAPMTIGGEGPPDTWEGLGLVPLIIIVAGIVLIVTAGAVAVAYYSDAKGKEADMKKRVADLDQWALKQGGAVAQRWDAWKKENAKANKSFWDSLLEGIGSALPTIAIVGLALLAVFAIGKDEPERTSSAPVQNPARRRMRVQSVLFDRDQWDPEGAVYWLQRHGYRASKLHASDSFLRFRQFDPARSGAHTFRTITFGQGIKAVVAR
jgi:hypothetical protein